MLRPRLTVLSRGRKGPLPLLDASNLHHQRMLVSVIAPPRNHRFLRTRKGQSGRVDRRLDKLGRDGLAERAPDLD
jgi:hypothetical protein